MIDDIIKAIEDGNSADAIAMLQSIKDNNRGHEKLGSKEAVVITYPTFCDENLIDGVRPYVQTFFGGDHSIKNLRATSVWSGIDAVKVMPDWFKKRTGHMDASGFTCLLYQSLVELDLIGDKVKDLPEPYPAEEASLREDLIFKGVLKTIDAPLPT